jgi:hypothetical protein
MQSQKKHFEVMCCAQQKCVKAEMEKKEKFSPFVCSHLLSTNMSPNYTVIQLIVINNVKLPRGNKA